MDSKISKLNTLFEKSSFGTKKFLELLKNFIVDLEECDKLVDLNFKEKYSQDLLDLTRNLINQDNENKNANNCMMSIIGEIEEKFEDILSERNLNFDMNEQIYVDKFEDQINTMKENQFYNYQNDIRYLEIQELVKIPNEDDELAEIDKNNEQIPIDPFTQQEIQEPVRNKICNHIYDKVSISNYINQHNRPKCPKIGCVNRKILSFNVIIEDKELKEKIERIKHQSKV